MTPEQFIARWQNASGSELANAQSFVRELTELLELPPPNPAQEDTRDNDYCHAIMTTDRRFCRRAKAIYEYKSIGTATLLVTSRD